MRCFEDTGPNSRRAITREPGTEPGSLTIKVEDCYYNEHDGMSVGQRAQAALPIIMAILGREVLSRAPVSIESITQELSVDNGTGIAEAIVSIVPYIPTEKIGQ